MLSIRSLARAAPRTVSRLTSSAIRRPAARPSTLLQSSWKPAYLQSTAAFSTSRTRWQAASEDDVQLAQKLESEIEFETSMKEQDGTPATVKEYLENSPFQLEDTPGQEEVVLTRKFNDESIRVTFSIADLNAMDPENDFQDSALGDEDDVSGNNKASEGESAEEGLEGEELDQDQGFPTRLNIIIEKKGKGALNIEAVAQNGMIGIHNLHHYPDVALAEAKTAEKAHEAQNLYVGPPFENLDEDLQMLLERYLDERGVNTALAVFVPEYIELKEQNEYLRWLSSVKYFVE